MKPMTDTEKAQTYLQAVEYDIRKFLEDGEGVNPFEYFEDTHIALVEAMNLLGVELDAEDEGEAMLEAMIADHEEREHAAELENFDPITILEKQEQTGVLK